MELNLKRLLPLTGIVCGCLMSFVNAHDTNSQHARSMNDNSQMNEITPNAGPRVSNGADVFITADFIWWRASQDGMGYVFSNFGNGSLDSSIGTGSVGRGSVRHVADDWSPGFKVGIGLNLGHDGWDLAAEYTWLRTSNSSSTTNADPATSRLFPMWYIANEVLDTFYTDPGAAITSAFANWDLHFNVIDLEFARNHYISQYLTLRPHVGLKGAWIDQHYSVRYFSFVDLDTIEESFRMRNDQDYWGIGIRTGLDTAWYFMKNFCMYGDLAIAAMWSRFDVDRRDSVQNLVTETVPAKVNVFNTENDLHTIKPVIEFGLGLRYDWWFSDDDYHFGLQAGWEEQVWVNHNNLLHLFDEVSHGDLVTQGLTIKIRFDF